MVDAPRLRNVLSRLAARIDELRGFGAMDRGAYLADRTSINASKYVLISAIEDALAAANHVISAEAYRGPSDYADAFRSLTEAGVLENHLAERLASMTRFRNLLVHVYAEVDDARVHGFLAEDVTDLDRFVAAVLAAFEELEQV